MPTPQRLMPSYINQQKNKAPLVCLTAYTAPMATALDPHTDLLLVGDSLAMVIYGLDSTLGADMEMMIRHGQAVVRASKQSCVIVDMPFGSYQESPESAFRNAACLMKKTGCQGIKMEGGEEMAETVSFLTRRGIPVMGHIGLLPQSVNTLGGYKARGMEDAEARQFMQDGAAITQAGAFSLVIEGVEKSVATAITQSLPIPTIGIGASEACDGQILVSEDMLGMTHGRKPKFVKPYASLSDTIDQSASQYAAEVRNRQFPSSEFCYHQKKSA